MRSGIGRRKVPQLGFLVRFVLLVLMRGNGADDELIGLGAVDRLLTVLGIIAAGWRGLRTAVVGVQRRLLGAHLSLVFGRLRFQRRGGGALAVFRRPTAAAVLAALGLRIHGLGAEDAYIYGRIGVGVIGIDV